MKNKNWLVILLAVGLAAFSCRNEAFEQNRQRLIERTEIADSHPAISISDLGRTKEAYVDLTIGLNTFRHESKFSNLADTVQYLKDVIFNAELPREYFSGQNKIVDRFDGSGGWLLTFDDVGTGFNLRLNVADAHGQPVSFSMRSE